MKIALSVPGKFHTFPWVQAPYMAFSGKFSFPNTFIQNWENLVATSFGDFVARNLPDCDLYVGLSGSALPAGKKAHQRGAKFICDRGSSHIKTQDQLLREEHDQWGIAFSGIDQRNIDREEAEYAEADIITVPSKFVHQSFVQQGVSLDKLKLLPYGVNLSRFEKVAEPNPTSFDILFVGGMSLRKGVQYLVQAFQKLQHSEKSLTFVGTPSTELIALLKARGIWSDEIRVLGHIPQLELKTLMSRSHVLVLPSIEEGLAMVMAQSMACGCPVIASDNTGARDLFEDGKEGYIVPIRNVDRLTERLQNLADTPNLRDTMSQNSSIRVTTMGGWSEYGNKANIIFEELIRK